MSIIIHKKTNSICPGWSETCRTSPGSYEGRRSERPHAARLPHLRGDKDEGRATGGGQGGVYSAPPLL